MEVLWTAPPALSVLGECPIFTLPLHHCTICLVLCLTFDHVRHAHCAKTPSWDDYKFIPALIRAILEGMRPMLQQHAKNAQRSYVSDLIRQALQLII
eukprot:649846-Amphidinium_carterae.2